MQHCIEACQVAGGGGFHGALPLRAVCECQEFGAEQRAVPPEPLEPLLHRVVALGPSQRLVTRSSPETPQKTVFSAKSYSTMCSSSGLIVAAES